MAILKHMRRGLLVTASAIAITGSAYALPGPVDAIWKNTSSKAEQVMAAINLAATAPAEVIAIALEMVNAAVLLASHNPPIAIKGVTAACAAGSNPDAITADPQGATNLADSCTQAAELLKDIDPSAAASALEAAATISATLAGVDVETEVEVDVENPAQDVAFPDEPGPGSSGS